MRSARLTRFNLQPPGSAGVPSPRRHFLFFENECLAKTAMRYPARGTAQVADSPAAKLAGPG